MNFFAAPRTVRCRVVGWHSSRATRKLFQRRFRAAPPLAKNGGGGGGTCRGWLCGISRLAPRLPHACYRLSQPLAANACHHIAAHIPPCSTLDCLPVLPSSLLSRDFAVHLAASAVISRLDRARAPRAYLNARTLLPVCCLLYLLCCWTAHPRNSPLGYHACPCIRIGSMLSLRAHACTRSTV